ncbi:hypothetical protein CHGG_09628 [Chaetomium globosum CBS 148.51]|uniref:DNA (cytosine-5-)-methyltransferase n=1 Tax=Chaetomium globosum (strain ATCC 6205 / CBS 148.51 / DSM 1962 / NBRC 6347 / NRRL 1970) TaxID=306901 RepID=Q2GQX6_CHAGB|nr:uncharacterized protein CHGG_09628 [Chaetomium globosum CBS 148.51]EAQ83224.1 hypothetical protein CHGG_09628 [Chaetomium globosum CBS 148.51]
MLSVRFTALRQAERSRALLRLRPIHAVVSLRRKSTSHDGPKSTTETRPRQSGQLLFDGQSATVINKDTSPSSEIHLRPDAATKTGEPVDVHQHHPLRPSEEDVFDKLLQAAKETEKASEVESEELLSKMLEQLTAGERGHLFQSRQTTLSRDHEIAALRMAGDRGPGSDPRDPESPESELPLLKLPTDAAQLKVLPTGFDGMTEREQQEELWVVQAEERLGREWELEDPGKHFPYSNDYPPYSPSKVIGILHRWRNRAWTPQQWRLARAIAGNRSLRLPVLTAQAFIRRHVLLARQRGVELKMERYLGGTQEWKARLAELENQTGVSEADIKQWLWILSPESGDVQIQRLLKSECRKPLFLLQLLIAKDRKIQEPANFLGLLQFLRENYVLADRPQDELDHPAYKGQGRAMTWWHFLVFLYRLVYHCREGWPAATPLLARLTADYIGTMRLDSKARALTGYQARSLVLNKSLQYFSWPARVRPIDHMEHNWAGQRHLLQLAATAEPPLVMDKNGYRAVRAVLITLKKTKGEAKNADRAAKTWPPYRRTLDGIDERRDPEDDLSRSAKAGMLVRAAGYSDDSVDRTLSALGGSMFGEAPTVQTKSIPPAFFSGHLASQNIYSEWAARLRATRNAREAWIVFENPPEPGIRPTAQIYGEMFDRLYARPAVGSSAIRPGDVKEVFPVENGNLSEFEIARLTPPTPEELYDIMLQQDKIRPTDFCLAVLIRNSSSRQMALRYLDDSPYRRNIEMLRLPASQASSEQLQALSELPPMVFNAWITMLCRIHTRTRTGQRPIARRAPSQTYSIPQSPHGHAEDALKVLPGDCIPEAIALASAFQARNTKASHHDRVPWHMIMQALAGTKVLYSDKGAEFNIIETLATFLRIYERTTASKGIDPVSFEALCLMIRKALKLVTFERGEGGKMVPRPYISCTDAIEELVSGAHGIADDVDEGVDDGGATPGMLRYNVVGRPVYRYMMALACCGDGGEMVRLMHWLLDGWDREYIREEAKTLHSLDYHYTMRTIVYFAETGKELVEPAEMELLSGTAREHASREGLYLVLAHGGMAGGGPGPGSLITTRLSSLYSLPSSSEQMSISAAWPFEGPADADISLHTNGQEQAPIEELSPNELLTELSHWPCSETADQEVNGPTPIQGPGEEDCPLQPSSPALATNGDLLSGDAGGGWKSTKQMDYSRPAEVDSGASEVIFAGAQGQGEFIECELNHFSFYVDSVLYPFEMRPLQHLATKQGHDRFFFDGVLNIGGVKHCVEKVEVSELPIGNYGIAHSTTRGQIWVRSRLNSQKEVYYRLGKPALEYLRFYTPFVWVADLSKDIVDFSASMIDRGRQVGLDSFRAKFTQWLYKTHGARQEIQLWRRKHPSDDYPGDTISTPRDEDTTGTKWRNMASKGATEDGRWFGLVQKVHAGKDGSRSFDVTWFYRPVKTPCCMMKYPWPNELCLSDHCTCEEGRQSRVKDHEILGVHKIDWFGSPDGSKGEFFVRQTYIIESRRWVTLRKSHMACSHGPEKPRFRAGDTVLAVLFTSQTYAEAYEVVKVFKQGDNMFVRLRRLLRRSQVDPQAGAAPNELVYTDQLVVTKPDGVIGKCAIRFFRPGESIPTPYDRKGTGNLFYITHRLETPDDGEDGCVPLGEFPASLRQGFDPTRETFRKLRGMDLFCGSGNFGRGLEEGGAVEVKWANDIWDRAIHTYMANSPDSTAKPFLGSVGDLLQLALEGKYADNVPRPGDVDFISAGSPCPGFSLLTQDKTTLTQIKNQSLVASFASFVDFYRPKYGILETCNDRQAQHNRSENVLSQLFCAIVGMGYQAQLILGDAWSHGAPQCRKRSSSTTGPRLRLPTPPLLLHSITDVKTHDLGEMCNSEPLFSRSFQSTPFKFTSAAEATADLPLIGDGKAETAIAFPDHRTCGGITSKLRHQIAAIPTRPYGMSFSTAWYGSRPTNGNHRNGGSSSSSNNNSDSDSNPGRSGVMTPAERALFPAEGGRASRVSRVSNGWRRVRPGDVVQTVTTRCQPTDARAATGLHWIDPRPLTVLEIRRAQGFPDHEVLLGTPADQWKLVGNSVARQMALALGLRLHEAWVGGMGEVGSGGGAGAAGQREGRGRSESASASASVSVICSESMSVGVAASVGGLSVAGEERSGVERIGYPPRRSPPREIVDLTAAVKEEHSAGQSFYRRSDAHEIIDLTAGSDSDGQTTTTRRHSTFQETVEITSVSRSTSATSSGTGRASTSTPTSAITERAKAGGMRKRLLSQSLNREVRPPKVIRLESGDSTPTPERGPGPEPEPEWEENDSESWTQTGEELGSVSPSSLAMGEEAATPVRTGPTIVRLLTPDELESDEMGWGAEME